MAETSGRANAAPAHPASRRMSRGKRALIIVVAVVVGLALLATLFVFVALPAIGCPKAGTGTPAGSVSDFCFTPFTGGSHAIGGLVAGPDGNLWFSDGAHIGRMTPAGDTTEFALPADASATGAIVVGSDGNLWFIEQAAKMIGRITTGGVISYFPLPDTSAEIGPMSDGPGNAVWFIETFPDTDPLNGIIWGVQICRVTA